MTDAEPAAFGDLTLFRVALLRATAVVNADPDRSSTGATIQKAVETSTGKRVNHGALYGNFRSLVAQGLVTSEPINGRANRYTLTDAGKATVRADHENASEALDALNAGPKQRLSIGDRA